MKLYIAGKVTGLENYKELFSEATIQLAIMGYEVFNPANFGLGGKSHHECMKILLPHLLECAGIALLDNWRDSTGARDEVNTAMITGIPAAPVSWWVELGTVEGCRFA